MIVDEGVNRHQLDRGHAEPLQVLEHRRCSERGVLAAQTRRHPRMEVREALHVQLVDEGIVPRGVGATVITPGKGRIHDLALRHAESAVARVDGQVLAPAAHSVAEVCVAPAKRPHDRFGVRIEQQFVGVEAHAPLWIVRAVHPISIQQPGPRVRQVAMPYLVGLLAHLHHFDLALALRIEQAQLDTFRVLGEQREIHAFAVPGRSERIRPPGPYRPGRFHSTGFV